MSLLDSPKSRAEYIGSILGRITGNVLYGIIIIWSINVMFHTGIPINWKTVTASFFLANFFSNSHIRPIK